MRILRSISFSILALVAVAATIGCPRAGSCTPTEANGFSTSCAGPAGYMWTGSSCIWTRACNCTGEDCESLYQNQDSCEAAHAGCL